MTGNAHRPEIVTGTGIETAIAIDTGGMIVGGTMIAGAMQTTGTEIVTGTATTITGSDRCGRLFCGGLWFVVVPLVHDICFRMHCCGSSTV